MRSRLMRIDSSMAIPQASGLWQPARRIYRPAELFPSTWLFHAPLVTISGILLNNEIY
jgi:hypothetical protein